MRVQARRAGTEDRAAVEDEEQDDVTVRAKSSWARLIHKVYEADPLLCPKCQGPMRVIALIEDGAVIRRILEHLGLWVPRHSAQTARAPPARQPDADAPTPAPNAWSCHPLPDIA
jgi:hypothetical protein